MEHRPGDEANYDDPKSGPTYMVGVVGTVILICTVVLVQALAYDMRDNVTAEQVDSRDYLQISGLREEQRATLEGYDWSYPEEDRVRIPVQLGVEQVMERYGTPGGQ